MGEQRGDSTEEELVGQVTRQRKREDTVTEGPPHLLREHRHPPPCPPGESHIRTRYGHTSPLFNSHAILSPQMSLFDMEGWHFQLNTMTSSDDAEQSAGVYKINPNSVF